MRSYHFRNKTPRVAAVVSAKNSFWAEFASSIAVWKSFRSQSATLLNRSPVDGSRVTRVTEKVQSGEEERSVQTNDIERLLLMSPFSADESVTYEQAGISKLVSTFKSDSDVPQFS